MFIGEMNIDIIILVQANEKEAEDHKKTTEEKVSEQKSQDSEKVRIIYIRHQLITRVRVPGSRIKRFLKQQSQMCYTKDIEKIFNLTILNV